MKDNEIKNVLKNSKTIAMIGVSSEKKGEECLGGIFGKIKG